MFLTIICFSFLLWASISAAIQPGLSSSNVLCFIAIYAIVSFEQINHQIIIILFCYKPNQNNINQITQNACNRWKQNFCYCKGFV